MATTTAGPWSVKGVDPKAREIAKDLARRSNMTLGEWLNRFIAESGGEPETAVFQGPLREPHQAGASRRPTASAVPPEAARPDRAELTRIVQALETLSKRLDRSEADARDALQTLHASFSDLDTRLSSAEIKLAETDAGAVERRFEALAAELSEKVEAGRAEIAERLREAASGQFEKMEGALRDLSGHVEQTEQRSAQAIERLGHEVLRVAQHLNGRVIAAESRSAQAVERVSGDMARVADVVEGRMNEAERLQADALERLGSELSRIAERLADRIAGSERRSAAAIDDIGLQVTQAADRIDQRYDRATVDVGERIRQSEERTARLLEEARERFDLRSAGGEPRIQTQDSVAEPAAKPAPEPAVRAPLAAEAALAPAIFAPEPPVDAEPALEPEPTFEPIHDFSLRGADPFGPLPPMERLEPLDPFADDAGAFEPPSQPEPTMTPLAAHEEPTETYPSLETLAPEPVPAPVEEPERPKTTRELLESARSAARLAAAPPQRGAGPDVSSLSNLTKRFNLSIPKIKRKDAGLTLRTAVVASGTAAAIAVTAVGAAKVYGGHAGEGANLASAADRGAPMASLTPSAAPRQLQQGEDQSGAPADASAKADMAAVALSPAATTQPALPAPAVKPTPPEPTSAEALYPTGVRRIESGDRTGLAALIRAASMGLPGAQFYLAKLYESGSGGVRKDMVQARRWTAKAAQGGDVKAMHNLGLYYFEGDGGEKNVAAAASWFKRAAELGLQDSQYNLARLYQQGYGVSQNAAEAYKWYLVAAANGDAGARNDAIALKKSLGADEAAAAERSAAMLQAQARNAAIAPAAGSSPAP